MAERELLLLTMARHIRWAAVAGGGLFGGGGGAFSGGGGGSGYVGGVVGGITQLGGNGSDGRAVITLIE